MRGYVPPSKTGYTPATRRADSAAGIAYNAAIRRRPAGQPIRITESTHGRENAPSGEDHRRGHQPALQLGPPPAGARHHGRRLRGARRLPPHAPLPARPGASRARSLRSRRAAAVRRQQHPLRHLDQDRRMGARQAVALGAADPRRRSDPVGLRLGRRASPALLALAQAGELQGRPGRPARHRRSRLRPDEAPRRGDGLDPESRRRRQDADRRRHHRAADDVRTARRPD